MFAWALELGERVAGWWKARQQQKALGDLQRGQDILRQMEADGAVITERAKPPEVSPPGVAQPPAATAEEVSLHGTAEPPATVEKPGSP